MHILYSYIRGAGRLRRLNGGGGGRSRPRTAQLVATITAGGLARAVGPRGGRLRRGEARETCETGGRTGGRAGEWVARADGRMGGRVGGASGRAMAARAGGTWVRARVGSSGGGARAAAAAHRLARKVERMSMFTVAMVWWMMRVMSERMMTAGSRRRGHDARGTASSLCVGDVRRELQRSSA